MAKKVVQSSENGIKSKYLAVKSFFLNERTQFVSGLLISIVAIYIGLSLISFFFTGGADQSKIENVPLADLLINKGSVGNWTGVRGAYLADTMLNRWFGISSFFIVYFLGTLGLKFMDVRPIAVLRQFLLCSSLLLWGSLFFGFVFIKGYEDTFIYLGGQHGYFWSEVLITNIGVPGTMLFTIAIFLIIAIFASKRTIPILQRFLSFDWLKKRMKSSKKTNPEQPLMADDPGNWSDVVEELKTVKRSPDLDEKLASEPEDNSYSTTSKKVLQEEKKDEDLEFVVTIPQEEAYVVPEQAPLIPAQSETTNYSVEVPTGDDEVYDGSTLGVYDPKLDLSSYRNPSVELLKKYDTGEHHVDMEEQKANQIRIKQTLESFGISIASIKATVGPTITLYEVVPDVGVRISKIRNLGDDIALSLSALGIRIIAPIPGKGTIGIEVPNKDAQIVSMQSVIASRKFQECDYDLPVALGKTISNEVFMFDLCKMPHLLVAGATGQGKSVGLNAIITSLLYKKHPSELKFVLVDPKMVEFSIYSDIDKHYLAKLPDADKAIITDFTKVIQTLNSLCKEMDDRYDLLMKAHTRNIKEYNHKFINRKLNPQKGHKFMPYIVVVIDEFGDLIMTAGKEIELPIARIAQKARAVGIHMIIATQRPSTNIITGTIKANFPARVAFRVSSMIDSRTILDSPGANQLIGRGDLLFSQGNDMIRVQCAFVDTPEVEQIAEYISKQQGYPTAFELPEYVVVGDQKEAGSVDLSDRDPLFDDAARLIVIQQQGSTSLIQRKFSIGYNRAGRLMDQLEAASIVGGFEGSKARQVLVQDEYNLEQLLNALK